jgi:hypothetical protein
MVLHGRTTSLATRLDWYKIRIRRKSSGCRHALSTPEIRCSPSRAVHQQVRRSSHPTHGIFALTRWVTSRPACNPTSRVQPVCQRALPTLPLIRQYVYMHIQCKGMQLYLQFNTGSQRSQGSMPIQAQLEPGRARWQLRYRPSNDEGSRHEVSWQCCTCAIRVWRSTAAAGGR